MEKWKSKGKTIHKTESLLPPTRRQQQQQQELDVDSSTVEKRKGKRWTIGGFLKRISHRDGDASSSGEASSVNAPVTRRKKAKNIQKNKSSRRAIRSSLQTKKDLDFQYKSGKSLEINPFIFPIVESLPQEFLYSRSSDGSLDDSSKKIRKYKIKARVEAKRDKLCTNSSTDESSNESKPQNGFKNDVCLRRRRNARAERFMKSLCREESAITKPQDTDHTNVKNESRSPIDYQLKIQETENPLVKQTLQYFSDFDRRNVTKIHEREKKRIDSRRRQTQQIFPITSNNCDVHCNKSRSQEDIYLNFETKPSPAIQQSFNTSSLDSNYKTPRTRNPRLDYTQINSNYGEYPTNYKESDHQFDDTGIYSRIRSPSQRSDSSYPSDLRTRSSPSDSLRKMTPDLDKYSRPTDYHQHRDQFIRNFPENPNRGKLHDTLPKNNYFNISSDKYQKKSPDSAKCSSPRFGNSSPLDSKRRSSKNLEEALCELEEIYNSLQLGDEDLLERAEQRSMEEYSNKKMENILHDLENIQPSKVDSEPNILKDDMAFRRLRSSSRPSSDGHAILSNISYLITSPIVSPRDPIYLDPKLQRTRGKEPDIALDDVVFRNLHHANNTLKVVEPQPPFGIPLGPITGATESDYLHTKPSKSESRSRCEPDIVTDDLAFRNLRKDKNPDKNDSWEKPSNFVAKKKRAVRSLSANLYSLINKRNEVEWDLETNPEANLDINGNQSDGVPIKTVSPRWINSEREATDQEFPERKSDFRANESIVKIKNGKGEFDSDPFREKKSKTGNDESIAQLLNQTGAEESFNKIRVGKSRIDDSLPTIDNQFPGKSCKSRKIDPPSKIPVESKDSRFPDKMKTQPPEAIKSQSQMKNQNEISQTEIENQNKIENQNEIKTQTKTENQNPIKNRFPCESADGLCSKIEITSKHQLEKMEDQSPDEINKKSIELNIIHEQTMKDLPAKTDEKSKDLGPFTEHEISIYRQLCQELENLVDSTKTFESSTGKSSDHQNLPAQNHDSNSTVKHPERDTFKRTDNLTTDEIDEIGNEITCLREKLTNFVCTKETHDKNTNETRQESKKPNNKIDETNLVNEMPHCSRTIFNSRDATGSEGADTTLT